MASSDCLFVRNLTKDTTREELTALFQSDYVIKHAIIIHERHGGPSKGFGFVTFALESDAKEAMERDNFSLKGNKLKLAFAAKDNAKEQDAPAEQQPQVVDWKTRKDERRKTPEMIELEKRTVVLFGVGALTEAQLRKRLKKRAGGTVESISNFKDGDESVKRVVYAHADAVNGAVKEINGRSWGSEEGSAEENIVFARRLTQVALTPHQRSKSRLICRNLAFSITKQEVQQEFRKFGPVEEIVVNAKGFGFVQFYCRTDAEKAVELVNGTTTLGPKRPNGKRGIVAVDFALTKDHYEKIKTQLEVEAEKSEEEEPVVEEKEEEEEEEASSSSSSEEEEDEDDEEESASSDEEEESASSDEEEEEVPAPAQTKAQVDKGVRDRRTLFVRNLLFETTEETLRERFKEFGPVRGVKLCRDATQRSRGMGFVEFWNPESCDKALSTGALLLEGRELYCNLAVDKNQAESLRSAAAAGDVKEDKRHLHLVKASKVPANLVPASDVKKREFQDQETKTKLKNPLFFVSQTRLSVKNLCRKPSETPDAKTLRSVFKACAIRGLKERLVIEPPPRTSVRVLKATVFQEEGKQELSTGFGFVEMSSHAHAMAALKVLNNSPEFAYLAAGGKQAMKLPEERRPRLIVSFAIENGAKVRAQKIRAQESSKPSSSKKKPKTEEKEEEKGEEDQKQEKKPKRKRDEPRVVKKARPHLEEEGGKQEQQPQRVPKPKPLTNKAFERGSNAKRNTDELDQIMSKRNKMFDEPDAVESKKKRWFEE